MALNTITYEEQTWVDTQTPLNATHMNHIEEGITAVTTLANSVVNELSTIDTNITNLTTSVESLNESTSAFSVTDIGGITTSVPSGEGTNIQKLTLAKGIYLITVWAKFAANTTGVRGLSLTTDSTDGIKTNTNNTEKVGPVIWLNANKSEPTFIEITTLVSYSDETTVYACVNHNAGSALNCRSRIKYIKLA